MNNSDICIYAKGYNKIKLMINPFIFCLRFL